MSASKSEVSKMESEFAVSKKGKASCRHFYSYMDRWTVRVRCTRCWNPLCISFRLQLSGLDS